MLVQFLLLIKEFSENYLQEPHSQPQALRELGFTREEDLPIEQRYHIRTWWEPSSQAARLQTLSQSPPLSSSSSENPGKLLKQPSRKTKLKLLRKMFYERVPQNTITGFFAKQTITGLQYNFFGKQTIVWVHLCQQSWQPLSTAVSACWPNLQRNW